MKHEIYTFRARTLADALRVIRDHLGPDAAVLETRRLCAPVFGLLGGSTVEVTASTAIEVPSRLPGIAPMKPAQGGAVERAELENFRQRIQDRLRAASRYEPSLIERLATAHQ